MNEDFFAPEDVPSAVTPLDRLLRLRLEEAIGKYFYQGCDSLTQVLLSKCEWHFSIRVEALILMINCQEKETYWQILEAIQEISNYVEEFAGKQTIIRLCSPFNKGLSLEIQISEISAYRDWFEKRDS